jgi:Na+/melibiose symporter-like transporter
VGILLSSSGLGVAVYGVLRTGEWGWVQPKQSAPSWLGISPSLWLILTGIVVVRVFFVWERHVKDAGREPLVDTGLLHNPQLVGGLTMFFFQFLIQAGLFFTVPLYLSVALGLSALDTGIRLLPLSITLLVAALAIPKYRPDASPRTVVSWGLGALLAGIVSMVLALEVGAGAEIVTVPMLFAGVGVGALASQLGAVTVSSVPDEVTGDVGGLQNTMTNLGASLGTALAGSILIGGLTASFLQGIQDDPVIPREVSSAAQVQLASGVPFLSDGDLRTALRDADVEAGAVEAIVDTNSSARIAGLRVALAVLALIAVLALFLTRLLPTEAVGSRPEVTRSA